jgi:hypothetical protein
MHRPLLSIALGCAVWFAIACAPIQAPGAVTVQAPAEVTVFIPLQAEPLTTLNDELTKELGDASINVVTELKPGEQIDAWFFPKGTKTDYQTKVEGFAELTTSDWSIAQVEDSSAENPWSLAILNQAEATDVAALIDSLQKLSPVVPGETPPLVMPAEVIDPSLIVKLQIRPDGTIISGDEICPECEPLPDCYPCPEFGWCFIGF